MLPARYDDDDDDIYIYIYIYILLHESSIIAKNKGIIFIYQLIQ